MQRIALVIFWKDLRETLRDRRNLLRMFFLPAFMIPIMGHFFMEFADSNREKLETTVLTYAVAGAAELPELLKLYDEDSSFRRVDVPADQLDEAVRTKQIKFGLRIPANARQSLAKGEAITIGFVHYQAAPSEALIKERGTAPLDKFSERQRDWRLVFLGASTPDDQARLLNPVTFEAKNMSSERERVGHNLGTIIAYPLFIICFMGCSFAAVELAAGEKEKGTLETLIQAPIARGEIVFGKYMAVFTLGIVYATVSIISLSAWLVFEGMNSSPSFKNVLEQIGTSELLLIWLMLVPVTALFSSLVLALSVYAKSYQEATTLNGLANVFVVVTATIIFVPGINLTWLWSVVPVSNVGLVIRELIKGTLSNYMMIGSIFGSTLVIGAVLLAFCTHWFHRESVIFRE